MKWVFVTDDEVNDDCFDQRMDITRVVRVGVVLIHPIDDFCQAVYQACYRWGLVDDVALAVSYLDVIAIAQCAGVIVFIFPAAFTMDHAKVGSKSFGILRRSWS